MRALLATPMMLLATCAVASAGEECTCRANGQSYYEGTIMCIRGQLARCDMNQNVTSWQVIAEICPEASKPAETDLAFVPRPILMKDH